MRPKDMRIRFLPVKVIAPSLSPCRTSPGTDPRRQIICVLRPPSSLLMRKTGRWKAPCTRQGAPFRMVGGATDHASRHFTHETLRHGGAHAGSVTGIGMIREGAQIGPFAPKGFQAPSQRNREENEAAAGPAAAPISQSFVAWPPNPLLDGDPCPRCPLLRRGGRGQGGDDDRKLADRDRTPEFSRPAGCQARPGILRGVEWTAGAATVSAAATRDLSAERA